MSGSELDDLAEDEEQLAEAGRDHFDEETEVQEMDDDPTEDEIKAALEAEGA